MLDKDVGEELLKLDLSPRADAPANQIERIIDADRRYLKRWTRISITLWIIAALGAVAIFMMGGSAFPMISELLIKRGESTLQNPDSPLAALAELTARCLVFGSASFLVLVCAGLSTVLLLFRSRSATLRQINSNLLLISEQLKRVPPGTAAAQQKTPSGAGG